MKREELTAYDCNEGSYDSMGFPWEYKEMVYDKDKADAVMDAMEQRIKELEQALSMASDPALHPTCADCDKCQPKWISVKDRLPEENKKVLVSNPSAHTSKIAWKYRGHWFFDTNCDILEPTHWQPLPPPPTTEEK